MSKSLKFLYIILFSSLIVSGCSGVETKASYPTREEGSDKILYSDQKRESIWSEDDSLSKKLFGGADDETAGGAGIGVNSFLWRASLDTIAFMPVASADPFGGVIITDWYENPDAKGERFKLTVYILDKQLRADGIRVSVFKQKLEKANWRDVETPKDMALNIENAILTRAREIRISQVSSFK